MGVGVKSNSRSYIFSKKGDQSDYESGTKTKIKIRQQSDVIITEMEKKVEWNCSTRTPTWCRRMILEFLFFCECVAFRWATFPLFFFGWLASHPAWSPNKAHLMACRPEIRRVRAGVGPHWGGRSGGSNLPKPLRLTGGGKKKKRHHQHLGIFHLRHRSSILLFDKKRSRKTRRSAHDDFKTTPLWPQGVAQWTTTWGQSSP